MLPNYEADPQVRELANEADKLVTVATNFKIATAEQYTDAGSELTLIKGAQKRLEAKRVSITRPMDAAKQAVMDLFRSPAEKLASAEAAIKRAMVTYSNEQERLQREAQRKLDEQARKERERLEAQAAKAAEAGKVEKAEVLEHRAAAVVAPIAQVLAPKVSGVSLPVAWKFSVDDPAKVPREYLMIDESKIRKIVTALKGDTKIDGVRVWSEKQVRAGAA